MAEWPRYTIGELIESGAILIHKDGNHGANYPRNSDFGKYGLPFLTAKSLSDWRVDIANAPRLSKGKAATFKFGFVARGDVLLSHNATVGRVAVVPEIDGPVVIGTSLTQYRVDQDKIDPRFLALYFASRDFQNELSFTMSQTTRNQVPTTAQRRLPVSIPPIFVQRQIVDAVYSLIDKIELNRCTNETLEAMARAIFRDWFVEFGPSRAKMAGREPYLAPELWALFPDRIDNNTGLPERWEMFRLDQIARQHTQGLTPGNHPDEEFEHFSIPAYDAGQNPVIEKGSTIKSNKAIVPKNCVLFSKLNPEISRVWIPEAARQRQQISSTEFLAFTPEKGASRALLFCLFRDGRFRDMMESMVTGTSKSHQRISPKSLLVH